MKCIYLTSQLFLKVLESSHCKIGHIVTDQFSEGEKVAIIEDRENCPSKRAVQVFRYIESIEDSEFITSDEMICSITLSSLPTSII